MRITIVLECSVCKSRNYKTSKNKNEHSERLEQMKFCPTCNKRVIHKETK